MLEDLLSSAPVHLPPLFTVTTCFPLDAILQKSRGIIFLTFFKRGVERFHVRTHSWIDEPCKFNYFRNISTCTHFDCFSVLTRSYGSNRIITKNICPILNMDSTKQTKNDIDDNSKSLLEMKTGLTV